MRPRGIFITGTDTGVGKSLLASALIRTLRSQKMDVVGFKPVACGDSDGIWQDAVDLFEASGRSEPIDVICPVRYKAPKAPTIAAREEGRLADTAPAYAALQQLLTRHASVIVEGVGGLLVPLDDRKLVSDFAADAGFPVLVVCRAALGTINHTLLTLSEICRARLHLFGVVMNITRAEDANVALETEKEIERIAGVKIIGTIPFLGSGMSDAVLPRPLVEHVAAVLNATQ